MHVHTQPCDRCRPHLRGRYSSHTSRKATLSLAHDEIVIVSLGPSRGQSRVTSGFAIATVQFARPGAIPSGVTIVCRRRWIITERSLRAGAVAPRALAVCVRPGRPGRARPPPVRRPCVVLAAPRPLLWTPFFFFF